MLAREKYRRYAILQNILASWDGYENMSDRKDCFYTLFRTSCAGKKMGDASEIGTEQSTQKNRLNYVSWHNV